jgi:multiple sugar transport system substrate-binding protein
MQSIKRGINKKIKHIRGGFILKKVKHLFAFMMVFVLILSGCSGGGESEEAEGGGDNKTVEVVAHPAYSLNSSDPKRVTYLKNQIETFESNNENVEVKMNALSSNIPEAMAKLLEQASQGRASDVAQIDSYILPRYYDHLQPLDSYLEELEIPVDGFFPFAQEVMKGKDGKVYGLQFTTDVRVLYYRKDLVSNAPQTWAEVLSAGKKLKEQGYSFLYPGGRGEGTTVTTVLPFFWGQGGKLVNEESTPVFGEGKNREAMLDVLSFLEQTVESGITPKRVSTYGAEADLNSEVATGKVAMFLGGNWQASQIKNILGEEEFKKWAVAPIPHEEGGQFATTAGGWAWGVFAKDKEKQKAAVDYLVQSFVGKEGMAQWSNIGGYLPTRKSVYETETYEGNKFTNTFREHLDQYAKMRPSSEAYPEISAQLQIAASSVVSGSKSPEQALNDAWEVVKQK